MRHENRFPLDGTLSVCGARKEHMVVSVVLGSRGHRGFSMVEILVELAVIGILAYILGFEILRFYQRQNLETTANNIVNLMQRAPIEMQRRGVEVFVQVGPLTATGVGSTKVFPVQLIADTNNDGVPNVGGGDTLIQELDIPVLDSAGNSVQQVAFSSVAPNQFQTSLWSDDSTPDTNPRWLGCDFLTRTLNTGPPAQQIAGVATLTMTHTRMLDGSLSPKKLFIVRANPLWQVTLTTQVP
jgi:prepilin-type N-terminal cleavage/methylation domain-containing protein